MSATNPSTLIAKALRHHGAGELDAADSLYRQVLTQLPDHPDALHLHGVVAHQRGRHQIAVDAISRAVARCPENPAYLGNLGEAYRGQRQFREAMDCYRRALAINPADANALNNLGLALHQSHCFDEARERFEEALALAPADPEIRVNLGNLFRDQGDLDAALRCYRDAVDSAPGFGPAHAWMGVTLYELGMGDEAVRALTRATELAPLDLEAHNNLKRVRWNLNQLDHLHDSFRAACAAVPHLPDAHLNLAESLVLNASFGEARGPIDRALALDPRSARAHSLLGQTHAGLGELDAAIRAHERALELSPEDPLLRESFSISLLRAGRHERAREILDRGHRAAPRRSAILAHLTIAMSELEDPALEALTDYEHFVHSRLIDVPQGFADLQSFNEALHAELESQHNTPNHALEQTMRGGTQTLNNLFQKPTGLVAVLKRQIQTVVDDYVASLAHDATHPFLRYRNPRYVFTGAWSTILRANGYDGSHIHNEGWLSGTYYVRVPTLTPRQHADREGYIQFGEPPALFVSERNSTQRTVAPQVGLAVLFPSYIWHGVRAFRGGGVRHSVSYDIV